MKPGVKKAVPVAAEEDKKPRRLPRQKQDPPGREEKMHPLPEVIRKSYRGSGKLKGKVALITGGDSGIGRSVAVHFAREGANISINFLNEVKDANDTKAMVEAEGKSCLLIKGDLNDPKICARIIKETIKEYGQLDILVNNAGIHYPHDELSQVRDEQILLTFQTNIISMIRLSRLALPHLKKGARIINTTSVTAYRGSDHLIDYAATKGAIVSFTRSLSSELITKGIHVNAVAPGPIWTPLIASTMKDIPQFGKKTPMGRAGQPSEVAPAYVYLACEDSSYVTGQVMHVNGGDFQSS